MIFNKKKNFIKENAHTHTSHLSVLQLLGTGPYSSLYPSPLQAESGKWETVMKANESLLKEKELIIDRYLHTHLVVFSTLLFSCVNAV